MSNDALWQTIFKLYDRDNSGLADEDDIVAAMVTTGRTEEQAKRMLAHTSEDGRLPIEVVKRLLEQCVSLNLADGEAVSSSTKQRVRRGPCARHGHVGPMPCASGRS